MVKGFSSKKKEKKQQQQLFPCLQKETVRKEVGARGAKMLDSLEFKLRQRERVVAQLVKNLPTVQKTLV